MSTLEIAFWASAAVIFYVFFGYAMVLSLWARLASRPVHKKKWEPTVSIVIATRDDKETVLRKIADCSALDYPSEKLEIIVSLDGGSESLRRAAVEALGRRRGVVLASGSPVGKAAALDRGVAVSRGEVLVFCDARQHVDPSALHALVNDLADPEVGAVSGELILLDEDGGQSGDGAGIYWRYEKALRSLESRVHSAVGATGALYALRRELYRPLPRHLVLDDVLVPMRAVFAGLRTTFEPAALVFDQARPPEDEYRRRVRTLIGNFQLLQLAPELLSPATNPIFLQYLSHKVGRLVTPYLLVLLLVLNFQMREGFYLVTLVAQCTFYLLAAVGAILGQRHRHKRALRIVYAPYDFVLMHWAAVAAFFRFSRGFDLERVWPRPVGSSTVGR